MKIPKLKIQPPGEHMFAGVYLKFIDLTLILEAVLCIVLLHNVSALVITVYNCVAEYFSWAGFNVCHSFITVNYSVYTQEVIGNIFESYSMTPIIGSVVLVSAAMLLGFNSRLPEADNAYYSDLQANEAHKFNQNFLINLPGFGKIYRTLPEEEPAESLSADYMDSFFGDTLIHKYET